MFVLGSVPIAIVRMDKRKPKLALYTPSLARFQWWVTVWFVSVHPESGQVSMVSDCLFCFCTPRVWPGFNGEWLFCFPLIYFSNLKNTHTRVLIRGSLSMLISCCFVFPLVYFSKFKTYTYVLIREQLPQVVERLNPFMGLKGLSPHSYHGVLRIITSTHYEA